MQRHQLTVRQEKFCIEYAKSREPGQAYRAAYNAENSSARTISTRAAELLTHSGVAARVNQLIDKAAQKCEFEVADVLKHWVAIATADPAEIMQLRRSCCRYCYGLDHEYQWSTEIEYARARAKAIQNGKERPSSAGGFGFNATAEAAASCPNCFGLGEEQIWIEDTRKLKGGAKLLYAGVRKTNSGIQVLTRSQDDALFNIAKFLGMFKERVEVSTKNENPILTISAVTNDPVEASKIYQKIMNEG